MPLYRPYKEGDLALVFKKGAERFTLSDYEVINVDTLGRHHQEEEMLGEIQDICLLTTTSLAQM